MPSFLFPFLACTHLPLFPESAATQFPASQSPIHRRLSSPRLSSTQPSHPAAPSPFPPKHLPLLTPAHVASLPPLTSRHPVVSILNCRLPKSKLSRCSIRLPNADEWAAVHDACIHRNRKSHALSSSEAEFMAACTAASKPKWLPQHGYTKGRSLETIPEERRLQYIGLFTIQV